MKNNKKGFTLAELLIVVAIIAVLVGISIPVFTNQLEKSREAVDAANLRAAYAEVMTNILTGDAAAESKTVKATQTKADWQGTNFNTEDNNIGGIKVAASTKGWTVAADVANSTVTISPLAE